LPKPDAVVGLEGDGVGEDQLHLARAGDSEGYEGIDGTGVFKGYGWTLDGGDGETDGGAGPARFGGRTVEAGGADGHEMGRLGDTQRQLPGDVVGYLKLYLVAEGGLQDIDVVRPPLGQGLAGFDAESAAAGFEIVADAGGQGDIAAEHGGEFDRIDDAACGERSDHRRGQRKIFEPASQVQGNWRRWRARPVVVRAAARLPLRALQPSADLEVRVGGPRMNSKLEPGNAIRERAMG